MVKCALCNETGRHDVWFEAFPLGHAKVRRNRVAGHFNISVCDSHRTKMQLSDVITTNGWERIQQAILSQGKPLLDRSTVRLIFQ